MILVIIFGTMFWLEYSYLSLDHSFSFNSETMISPRDSIHVLSILPRTSGLTISFSYIFYKHREYKDKEEGTVHQRL